MNYTKEQYDKAAKKAAEAMKKMAKEDAKGVLEPKVCVPPLVR